jgi:hypothetical protein
LRSIALSFVVAGSSLACSAPSAGPVTLFDPCEVTVVEIGASASPAEARSVAEGIAMWNRTGGTRFTLDEVPGASRIVVHFQDAAAAFHGLYDGQRGELYVNHALVDDHQRAITVAHELGHAVGLLHVDDRVSVMRRANLVVEPTSGDVVALAELWGACPPR